MSSTEKQLRERIRLVLSKVTEKMSPRVYDTIQVETGYKRIEAMMIEIMVKDNLTASATIPHIESMI